ncbi:OprD family outer membrane porin, partial [Pseudomonas sp. NPDC077382]
MTDLRNFARNLLCVSVALSITGPASAAFLDDSKATVELRNFYMNRDFRQSGADPSKA